MENADTSKVAINIRSLSKVFRLYAKPFDRVKEALLPLSKAYHQPFTALEDVNLIIHKGETVGIVGRNGSGKSTLLQIICGILKPTNGDVFVNGRISALLELGAGFNPEFSGIQNVYLNGTILGMSRSEIDGKIDQIIDFADIGDFIDQPVKSYSSGMFIRLAFAVAINMEPEILIVDEALSVGDEAFQRKCFAQIKKIQEAGGTILFVTHSAGTVVELCSRAILLDSGELLLDGAPIMIVSHYHKMIFAPEDKVKEIKTKMRGLPDRYWLQDNNEGDMPAVIGDEGGDNKRIAEHALDPGEYFDPNMVPVSTVNYESKGARISEPKILNREGERVNILVGGEKYFYSYRVRFDVAAKQIKYGMLIKTLKGVEVSGCSAGREENDGFMTDVGYELEVKFPFRCDLNPGVYFLNAGILGDAGNGEEFLARQMDIAMFRVEQKAAQWSTATVNLVGFPEISRIN